MGIRIRCVSANQITCGACGISTNAFLTNVHTISTPDASPLARRNRGRFR